jgi:hypothetical protein
MLRKLKLQTLKQKLWAIVAISCVVRVIIFFVLPNKPSSLVPDEGTYAIVADAVFKGLLASDTGFYRIVYNISKPLILPAQPLMFLGLSGLDAVRVVSTVYGFFGLVTLVIVVLKFFVQQEKNSKRTASDQRFLVVLVTVFAFLPSHFVWSNLALRESGTELGLILTYIFFHLSFNSEPKIRFVYLLLFFFSMLFTFFIRPQVGWVLSLSLLVTILFRLKSKVTYFLLVVLACAVLVGSTTQISGSTTQISGESSSLVSGLKPLTSAGEIISLKQKVNQLDAASAIQTQYCPLGKDIIGDSPSKKLESYFCIVWRSPYMVTTFLFRPIIGVDVTSMSSLLAAGENLFWLALFVSILYLAIKRRNIEYFHAVVPSLIFFVLYIFSASAYEGNMGTAFRHKSLILWVSLLVFFSLFWQNAAKAEISRGHNSQESAV